MSSAVYTYSSDVAFIESEPERIVALKFTAASPVIFTHTAAAIWKTIAGEKTVHEIISELSILYQIQEEEIASHIHTFLQDLEKQGYIHTL